MGRGWSFSLSCAGARRAWKCWCATSLRIRKWAGWMFRAARRTRTELWRKHWQIWKERLRKAEPQSPRIHYPPCRCTIRTCGSYSRTWSAMRSSIVAARGSRSFTLAPSERADTGVSQFPITASVSNPNIRSEFLGCLNVCIQARSIPVLASGWPFVNELSSDITAGSGSSPSPDRDRDLSSHSRSKRWILLVEDNRPDVFLIREAIRSANVDAHLEVLADGEQALRYIDTLERDEAAQCPELIILD